MQHVVFSFFRLKDRASKYWAFKAMQLAHRQLKRIEGLRFYKLLGTGAGNGFSWYPDYSTYGLMTVWNEKSAADRFMQSSEIYSEYVHKSDEQLVFRLKPIEAHGTWSNQNPFEKMEADPEKPIAVLTRATINLKSVFSFWKTVKNVSKEVKVAPGQLFSKGIGEWPLIQQATFSAWENMKTMKEYAYRNRYHSEVIKKTRKNGWFREEMFARFQIEQVEGSWFGENPMQGLVSVK
jgi:hypothetical protein